MIDDFTEPVKNVVQSRKFRPISDVVLSRHRILLV